jgi:hypothetical protein
MSRRLDDTYLKGPVKYYEGEWISGRKIYFFGDDHWKRDQCPMDSPRISMSAFLQKICRWNPEKTFHLLLEVPGHTEITIAPDRRQQFISQVYQQVYKKKQEPNLVTHGIDIRYPGIKRALTLLKKSTSILKNIVEYQVVVSAEKKKLLQMLPQLLTHFEDVDVDAYMRLFIRVGHLSIQPTFQSVLPRLSTYFKHKLSSFEMCSNYISIVQTLLTRTPEEQLPTKPLLRSFLNSLQMVGVLLTDLAILLCIFSIPIEEEIIVFAGMTHIRNTIEFLIDPTQSNFFITEEVQTEEYYQCLPLHDIMRELR